MGKMGKLKYRDSVEKSAEYLRLALQHMSKQSAALHPVSYAVWYEYVAGNNASLKSSIDEHLQKGATLDESATHDIYHQHVADINEHVARRVSEGIQKVMAELSTSAARAGDQAGQFGTALEKWRDDLSAAKPDAKPDAGAILNLTRTMQDSVAVLKDRLDDSHREIEQLRQEVVKAREEGQADGLTGLLNRRGFDQAIAACLAELDHGNVGPSLLIADIDHFKRVNDTYGHVFGDRVLAAVGQILKKCVKGKNTAARFGGEEFIVLLPAAPVDEAGQLAEQIRTMVQGCRIKRSSDKEAVANITISLGVTGFRAGESVTDFVARADAALYVSKNEGRNRVTIART
jgi:diguanylate cyclase